MNFFFLILRLFIFAAKINFWEWLGSWWETGTILCSNESWKMIWWSVWRIFLFGSMNPDPLTEIRPKTVPSIIGQKTINSTGWRLLILLVSHFKISHSNISICKYNIWASVHCNLKDLKLCTKPFVVWRRKKVLA